MSAYSTQRPDSRASTTSATSEQHHHHESHRPMSQSAHASFMGSNVEAAISQWGADNFPQQQYQPQQQQYQQQLPHQHQQQHHTPSASFPVQGYPSDQQYMQPDPPYASHVRVGSVAATSDVHDDKRRKGSAVTATNDKELREMLAKNLGRPLKEVAQEVIQKERTPMAEKTKQLFAMLWLRAVCKPAKTSVPRNRVYTQYSSRCGTERVVPLNPASFGKLVRVIFPGIQTRRLGVRGESKYHYVDLALQEEQNPLAQPAWPINGYHDQMEHPQRPHSASRAQIDFDNIPRLQADTAVFPDTQANSDAPHTQPDLPRGAASKGQTFAYPESRGMQAGNPESMTYPHILRFPSGNPGNFSENESVNLPSIHQYLPPRTDVDTAEALYALYRTHCTSLIDSIRFCKEKQFFRLYTSFHGTLTVPVQKLFTHPNLAPWIEQCDLIMYRTMIRFVSHLTLQAAPVMVINIMSNISMNLHGHIERIFSSQPHHVLEARLRPATVFAGLLYRLIRVNQSAHAAANLLTIDQNREQMWREWATMVNPKRVMEAELPNCGYEEAHKILTTEMRALLEPLPANCTEDPFGYNSYSFEDNGSFAQYLQDSLQSAGGSQNGPSAVTADTVLDRWSAFLSSLPSRFPQAPARTLLHAISAVGTGALRDITILNGASYGHWWVLKIFVDEMTLWLAEMGGFLEPAAPDMAPNANNQMYSTSGLHNGDSSRSNAGSRVTSHSPDMYANGHNNNTDGMFSTHLPQHHHHHHQMSFQQQMPYGLPVQQPQKQQSQESDLEDSGIGMSLMDDDLTTKTFGVNGPHVGMEGMGAGAVPVQPL